MLFKNKTNVISSVVFFISRFLSLYHFIIIIMIMIMSYSEAFITSIKGSALKRQCQEVFQNRHAFKGCKSVLRK